MKRILLVAGFSLAMSSPVFANAGDIPGTYRAETSSGACTIRLDAPSNAPEFSRVVPDHVAGFAIGFPNCALGLDRAVMWRAAADGTTLELMDGAGLVVFSGQIEARNAYTGQGSDGAAITLTR